MRNLDEINKEYSRVISDLGMAEYKRYLADEAAFNEAQEVARLQKKCKALNNEAANIVNAQKSSAVVELPSEAPAAQDANEVQSE